MLIVEKYQKINGCMWSLVHRKEFASKESFKKELYFTLNSKKYSQYSDNKMTFKVIGGIVKDIADYQMVHTFDVVEGDTVYFAYSDNSSISQLTQLRRKMLDL